ncbi:kinesin motor domain-containing protein [Cystoisospora suis]|uniref:Kinesin motor domain-containing protein n=1 Tax=Cystoisospora suis TaxID=483139 RepID=A0A2C6L3R2_9APIC|nr:kinesin motor domain-containing protein [Cystoisospora suis]
MASSSSSPPPVSPPPGLLGEEELSSSSYSGLSSSLLCSPSSPRRPAVHASEESFDDDNDWPPGPPNPNESLLTSSPVLTAPPASVSSVSSHRYIVHHTHTPLAASLSRKKLNAGGGGIHRSRDMSPSSSVSTSSQIPSFSSSSPPPLLSSSSSLPPLPPCSSSHTSEIPSLSSSQPSSSAPSTSFPSQASCSSSLSSPSSNCSSRSHSLHPHHHQKHTSNNNGGLLNQSKGRGPAGGGGHHSSLNQSKVHVKVIVRCRPMTSAEERGRCMSVVDLCEETNEVTVRLTKGNNSYSHHNAAGGGNPGSGGGRSFSSGGGGGQGGGGLVSNSSKVFRFDGVCPVSTTQQQLFEKHVQPLVDEVLQGFNCTVFAYGQTGTGKTYTVEGAQGLNGAASVYHNLEDVDQDSDCGLVARSVQRIFNSLRQQNRPPSEYTVTCSFLEIYNEELIDLFASSSSSPPSSSSSSALSGFVSAASSQASTASDLPDSQTSSSVPSAVLNNNNTTQPRLRIYEDLSNSIPSLGYTNHQSSSSRGVSASSSSSSTHQQGRGVVRVDGLEEKEVHSEKDVFNLLRQAAPRRSFAASSANSRSSRSHTIFSISVCIRESATRTTDLDPILKGEGSGEGGGETGEGKTGDSTMWRKKGNHKMTQKKSGSSTGSKSGVKGKSYGGGDMLEAVIKPGVHTPEEEVIRIGKLNLVDLAGSENIYKSWGSTAEEKRRREALTINKSLLTLGRCINALVDNSSYIPYRDSKLTRLLQDSLGGCTKTCLIATISPADDVVEETINTLDYAYRAKSIQNIPVKTLRHSKSLLLSSLLNENQQLKLLLSSQREKDGVFLPLPIYQQQESKLLQQEEELRLCQLDLQKKRTDLSHLNTRLEKFLHLEGEYERLKREREKLQGLYEKTVGDLTKAQHSNQRLKEKVKTLERKESFLTENFLLELRQERITVSSVRKSLHEAIVDLLKICEYRKILERRQGSVRKTCTQFSERLDQSLIGFLEKQEKLDVKLKEVLKDLVGLEKDRTVWMTAANEDMERFCQEEMLGVHQKTYERREESLKKVLEDLRVKEGENEKTFHGWKDKLASQDLLERTHLMNTWASTKKVFLEGYEEQERKRRELEKHLCLKDAQESKQVEQVHQLVDKWETQESKHTSSTCDALQQLAAQLATWKEKNDRDFQENVMTPVMTSVQENLRVLFKNIQDENQRKLEREIQSLQHQLMQIRREQLVQLEWTESTSRAVSSATDGLHQVGRERTKQTLQGLEDILHTAQEIQTQGETFLTHAQGETDRMHEERKRLRDHLDHLQAQMSSTQQNIDMALGEVLSQDKKAFHETADTLKKALVKKRIQQENEVKKHAEIGKSLEIIQSLTSDARNQRREDIKEAQQRAGAFVREILSQVPTKCSYGRRHSKESQNSPVSSSPSSVQPPSSTSDLSSKRDDVSLSEEREQNAVGDHSLREHSGCADSKDGRGNSKESSGGEIETLSTASLGVSDGCSCKECLVKDVEERWSRTDAEKAQEDSVRAAKAVEDLSRLPEILRNRFHLLQEEIPNDPEGEARTLSSDENHTAVVNSRTEGGQCLRDSSAAWQIHSRVPPPARSGDSTPCSDSCSVSIPSRSKIIENQSTSDSQVDQKIECERNCSRWMRKVKTGIKASPYKEGKGSEKPSVSSYLEDENDNAGTPVSHKNAENRGESNCLLTCQSPARRRTRSLSEDSESGTSGSSSSTATPCATLPYELSPLGLPVSPVSTVKAGLRESPRGDVEIDDHGALDNMFGMPSRDRQQTDSGDSSLTLEKSERNGPLNSSLALENTEDEEAEQVMGDDGSRSVSDENSPPSQDGSNRRGSSRKDKDVPKLASADGARNRSIPKDRGDKTLGKRGEDGVCGIPASGSHEQLSNSKSMGCLIQRGGIPRNGERPVLGLSSTKKPQQSKVSSNNSNRVAAARPHSSLGQKQKWGTDGKLSMKRAGGLGVQGAALVSGGEQGVPPPIVQRDDKGMTNSVASASPESKSASGKAEKHQGLRRVRSNDELGDVENEKKKVSKTGNLRTVAGGSAAIQRSVG